MSVCHSLGLGKVAYFALLKDLNEQEEPTFEVKPQSTSALEATTFVFECSANGNPEPVIEWYKDHRQLDASYVLFFSLIYSGGVRNVLF